jgi:hypothetical protein
MQEIDLQFRTMFADLVQQSLDDRFLSDFPPDGNFVRLAVKEKSYWYYDTAMRAGARKRLYVGPVDDPAIARRVEEFARLKSDAQLRRTLVNALRRIGLPAPDRLLGDIVEALANAGFFRLRAVLVGTAAFQTYAGILGVRFPRAPMQTGDADLSRFHSIAVAVGDSTPPMLDVLQAVDATFGEVPDSSDSRATTKFVNAGKFAVEFLTPNRSSDDYQGKPARMPTLGGASATPLRFLDFLIHEPQRSVLLHKYGVGVTVPAPERYAVHKLIVAAERAGPDAAKRLKDVAQCDMLVEALTQIRMKELLADAFREALARGPGWRAAIERGLSMTSPPTRAIFDDLKSTGQA